MINPAHARQRNAIATTLIDADLLDADDPCADETYERVRVLIADGGDAQQVADLLVEPEHLVDAVDPWVLEVAGRIVQAVQG